MIFKIGDHVQVRAESFYNGNTGVVSAIDNTEERTRYIVYLKKIDLNLAFYAHELVANGIVWD